MTNSIVTMKPLPVTSVKPLVCFSCFFMLFHAFYQKSQKSTKSQVTYLPECFPELSKKQILFQKHFSSKSTFQVQPTNVKHTLCASKINCYCPAAVATAAPPPSLLLPPPPSLLHPHCHRRCCPTAAAAAPPPSLLPHHHRCCPATTTAAPPPSLLPCHHHHCSATITATLLPLLLPHCHRCCCTATAVASATAIGCYRWSWSVVVGCNRLLVMELMLPIELCLTFGRSRAAPASISKMTSGFSGCSTVDEPSSRLTVR